MTPPGHARSGWQLAAAGRSGSGRDSNESLIKAQSVQATMAKCSTALNRKCRVGDKFGWDIGCHPTPTAIASGSGPTQTLLVREKVVDADLSRLQPRLSSLIDLKCNSLIGCLWFNFCCCFMCELDEFFCGFCCMWTETDIVQI